MASPDSTLEPTAGPRYVDAVCVTAEPEALCVL